MTLSFKMSCPFCGNVVLVSVSAKTLASVAVVASASSFVFEDLVVECPCGATYVGDVAVDEQMRLNGVKE